jgi:photosystem II stability/assembly factor-like uncharacterized protein
MARTLKRLTLGITGLLIITTTADLGRPAATLHHFDAPDAATREAAGRRAPLGRIDLATMYDRAAAQRERMTRFSSGLGRTLPAAQPAARVWKSGNRVIALDGQVSPTAVLDAWTPLGPGNIGGRTRVVRYHPVNHNTIFAAGVSGGIWRTDDNGASWRPIADGLANLAVNALAIDPRQPDVMYAGTGEGYFREEIRGTGLPLRGSGIFATRDGGATWRRLAATATDDFLWVNDLEIGIGDSRRLYAATRTGVWRSSDAGETWTQLLATNVRGGCLDLAMRPDQADDALFASCGSYEQATVYRFPRAGANGAPELVLSEAGMGLTSLAIAPSNPEIVYALAASNDPGPGGTFQQGLLAVYRSDRGGAAGSWEARVRNTDAGRLNTLLLTNASGASAEECGGPSARNTIINMGWYANVIAVDPRDPDRVWAAGVDWFRSDDGGRTWGVASFMTAGPGAPNSAHVDQHAIAFHPDYDGQSNQILLIGNDGGVARTSNARGRLSTGVRAVCAQNLAALEIRWESLNHDYGVTQFYYGLPFPDGKRYLGGAQDNSTPLGSDTSGANGWTALLGGDGGYVALDPGNPQIVYAESQNAFISKSVNGGTNFTTVTRGLDASRSDYYSADANYLFVAPFVMDPADANRLWLGGDFLYRTTSAASTWIKASRAMPDGGLVSTIAVSPIDANRVVAGTNNGYIVSSSAALAATSTTEWSASRAREGWVTSVAFDPGNSDVVYATYGNFGGQHLYRSVDRGATWSSIDGTGSQGLPDIPVHCIVVDPVDRARLYLGTDAGVFVSIDGGRGWMAEETGFGPAVTEWLSLLRDPSGRRLLFAFTHGRGAWRVELR